jgi:dienelactone hydrolase
MPDTVLPQPRPDAFGDLMRALALALHGEDQAPRTRAAWEQRRAALRRAMFNAMGPSSEEPSPLHARTVGVLRRQGYRIEKVLFESRPGVWVTSSLYLPEPSGRRYPAVLAVHGHWAGARRDPVVQARCLGLVKLGFVVLAVDAFGAGERYTAPAPGTYHGALYGSTLWPTGHTLLGMQVYDNRRAVDYLRSRPEVDGEHLGITGASGGGNQTMYAGALDERFQAVVPVCSVGTYQAYLRAACCVCEVLPGALRFAEEGDVLALAAPRALMVINATRDAFQFSVGEAAKSIARARPVFELYSAADKLRHVTFESGHAYSQPMREAMYGWMTRWLKNEGDGRPIAEPNHQVERSEDLACFPDRQRPSGYLLLPEFAAREGARLKVRAEVVPDHVEEWESTTAAKRGQLRREILGDFPRPPHPTAQLGETATAGNLRTTPVILHPEANMPVPALLRVRGSARTPGAACLLLHLDGKSHALDHSLAGVLLERSWIILAPDLRATGETRPQNDTIAGAPDHNSAEHALWLGRPLLGQWVLDVRCLLDWLAVQPSVDPERLAVVGLGQAGIVALTAACLLEDQVSSAAAVTIPASFVTHAPYPTGTRMGLLAPGILGAGDIPHLAAMVAPRDLLIANPVDPAGKTLGNEACREAFTFTRSIYRLYRADRSLRLTTSDRW